MRSRKFRPAWVVLLVVAGATSVWAAVATQLFTVHVPVLVQIRAPILDQIKAHPGTGADVPFAVQNWWAGANSTRGINVTLETLTAFRHTVTPTSKRNARLDLAVTKLRGNGTWVVNTATASTNFAAGNENAKVKTTSNGTGSAQLYLTVTFLTTAPGTLLEGDYTLTVLGTATEN